jgi:PAS domain S-box-containing protein
MAAPARNVWWSPVVAVAGLGLAVLVRWLLDPVLGDTLPLVTLFGAVAAAVWLAGSRTAMLVALLGYVACAYIFIEPRGRLGLDRLDNVIGVIAYLFTCGLIIAIGHAMRVAQARASERRELLHVTLRSIGDAVVTTDVEGRITSLNAIAEALTGWTQAEARTLPLDTVFRIVNEETRQPVENPAARALREGRVVGLANHTLLLRRDGSECPIDDSAAPIRDEHGTISGCVLIFRDVTLQRQTERERAARLQTARLLAAIVESSDDAIISKSLDGTIQTWNAAAERLFGHAAAAAVGRPISIIIPPERRGEEAEIIASLKAGRRIEHYETERVRHDGQRIQVSLTISPLKDDAGQVVGASKIVRDITERKRTAADRERLAVLVETSTDFFGVCDLQGMPLFVNRAGLEMVGLDSLDQARRTPVAEFFFPEDRPRIMEEFLPAVLQRGHGEIEVRFRHFRTGQPRWMAYKVLTLTDDEGRPNAFATVSQDVSERKRLEDDLRKLAGDLANADRRKDEFLATLAHELRNPLAPLANMIEVMKRADSDAATLTIARNSMERQVAQLVRLVEDLLDLSRINYNRLELRPADVDVATIVRQAVETARPACERGGLHVRVALTDAPYPAHADPARLAQVFGNLLNNACKYTGRGGSIAVTAARNGTDVVVSIKDTGIGIPSDKLETVFDMFVQADRSLERSQEGLGIGLTLVRRLVEMHGGSIAAHSEGAGRGSEFVVRLPLQPRARISAATAVATPARPPAMAITIAPEESDGATRPRRILIVDDNSDAAVSLAMLLQTGGNDTHTVHDGIAAVEAAEQYRPEIMLLDIGLPRLNGHDVCRRIRQQPWGRDVRIIALTGWGQESDRKLSQEAGFDGHLVKPVDYAALVEMLDRL